MKRFALIFTVLILFTSASLFAEEPFLKASLEAEFGTVKVFYHTYQVGENSSNFDFVKQGGQELLYPFQRYTVNLHLGGSHRLRFLYQPLQLDTSITAKADFTIDQTVFAAGTPVDLSYSFPFYRVSYMYDFIPGPVHAAAGLALQMRNASIKFSSVDGTQRTVSQNLGPVPAFVLYGRLPFADIFFAELDATGLWASSAIINGADFEFEGSILDASLRAGALLRENTEVFLNLRFLGGTAKGTSQYESQYWTQSEEKYTANYLATGSLTFGARLGL